MRTVRVCAVEELPPGKAARICEEGSPIAVFNKDGELYAVDDTCTHGKASLAKEGKLLEGDVVECTWHRGRFSLSTGKAVRFPAMRPLRTYAVRVEAGEIFVDITDGAQ